ncbi:MaoC family dehydratase [Amaricoccus solimangrovi]|uniref:MaoC family dehydratase n=1 Tax=Amaricoccus solimangrovi TaxID=2589815 RepID=A0A501WKG6_9RHOB|nr:MaoC family dehydratase [Amaricoccus solimangrovi]TPE49262.1 MaoC family dehydratase [Amaricoccus solimangrovi]
MKEMLYLEDLAPGMRFESAPSDLTAAAIKAFAAEWDPQPFHLDEAAAEATFFGGLAASGWHVGALTMRMLVETLPIAGGLIGAGVEIAWPRPTRPGDSLRVVAEIIALRPSRSKPDRGMVTVRAETLNQRGEVAQVMTSQMLAFRRPGERA